MENSKHIKNSSVNNEFIGIKLNHNKIIDQTISDINSLLLNQGLTVQKLTKSDEQWLFRNKKNLTLLWQNVIWHHDNTIANSHYKQGFEFTFKLCIEPDQPAGICISIYNFKNNIISISGFENFTRDNFSHPLNGRLFKYILYTIYLYGLALIEYYNVSENTLKVRVCEAINSEVLNYYLQHAGLVRLKETMDCETTFSALDSYITTLDSRLGL